MSRTLRYLCGIGLLTGVLLFPTSSAESNDDPAQRYETNLVQQEQEAPAAPRHEEPAV